MKTAIFTLIAMLIFAIIANIVLYRYTSKYYRTSNKIRLDPLGLKRFSSFDLSITKNREKPLVLFYGDSRCAQWPSPNVNRYRFANLGIAYQTTEQIYRRSFFQKKLLEKADIIVIEMGINDLKNIALFPDQQKQIIQTCKHNIKMLTDELKKMKKYIVLNTIFPTGKPGFFRRFFWSEKIESARIELNRFIVSLKEENITILDSFSSVDVDYFHSVYAKDLLHLNDKGYEELNRELIRLLKDFKMEQLQQ